MIFQTNLSAMVSAHNVQSSQERLSKSISRLSSGSKLTNPADDAAGLAVTSRFDSKLGRTNAAKNNITNAYSYTQTQDGYLSRIGKALNRMSELAILAQDATKTDADRALYNKEFTQVASYVTSAAGKDFNGVPLFSSSTLNITTDAEGTTFAMGGIDLTSTTYTDATAAAIDTVPNAAAALTTIKATIDQLSQDRATVGAYQSRLNYTTDQLMTVAENLSAASSRIQDVDVAEETTNLARGNIMVQSGVAMLAQANQLPQSVLKLLQ